MSKHQPKTPERPPRQRVGLQDAFALPYFITDSEKKNFYFRYTKESNLLRLQQAYYEPVINPETKKQVRIPTKDNQEDLVLVRLPLKYRNEDLKDKRDRVRGHSKDMDAKVKNKLNTIGLDAFNAEDV